MKNLPSVGFVYLVVVVFCCSMFFLWSAKTGWYLKVNTGVQESSDVKRWAAYLELMSKDYPKKDQQVEALLKASELRIQLKQFDKASDNLEAAIALKPNENRIRSKLLFIYFQTGKSEKAIKLARENFEAGQRDQDTISVLLESLALKKDEALATKIVKTILQSDLLKKKKLYGPDNVAIGLTSDQWTHDGKPGYLVISKSKLSLELSCYAGRKYMPIAVTIEDQSGKKIFSHIFKSANTVNFQLPNIPFGEHRLFIVKTDKHWVPSKNDMRKLGVRITPATLKKVTIQRNNNKEVKNNLKGF